MGHQFTILETVKTSRAITTPAAAAGRIQSLMHQSRAISSDMRLYHFDYESNGC
jgi:hypothetical protein